ncbi:MAG: hypothetical protein DME43_16000, partial [Verrucomicrobia bacterium]
MIRVPKAVAAGNFVEKVRPPEEIRRIMSARVLAFVLACAWVYASAGNVAAAPPSYDVEQAVALAQAQNP